MKIFSLLLRFIGWIVLIVSVLSTIAGIIFVQQSGGHDYVGGAALPILGFFLLLDKLPYSEAAKNTFGGFLIYGLVVYLCICLIYYGDRIRKFAGWAILVGLFLAWLLPKFLYWQAGGR